MARPTSTSTFLMNKEDATWFVLWTRFLDTQQVAPPIFIAIGGEDQHLLMPRVPKFWFSPPTKKNTRLGRKQPSLSHQIKAVVPWSVLKMGPKCYRNNGLRPPPKKPGPLFRLPRIWHRMPTWTFPCCNRTVRSKTTCPSDCTALFRYWWKIRQHSWNRK